MCLPKDGTVPVFCHMDSTEDGWLDMRILPCLPPQPPSTWELWMELEDFKGNCTIAHYGAFRLLREADHYQLVLGKFSEGTAGDSLSFHGGKPFTTYDAGQDTSGSNRVVTVHGAWWCGSCYQFNLLDVQSHRPQLWHQLGLRPRNRPPLLQSSHDASPRAPG